MESVFETLTFYLHSGINYALYGVVDDQSAVDDLSAYILTALLEPLIHTAYGLERDILKHPNHQLSKGIKTLFIFRSPSFLSYWFLYF